MDSAAGTSGGASSNDAGEDSESESESSSSSSSPRDMSEELESFRLQWKTELKKGAHSKNGKEGFNSGAQVVSSGAAGNSSSEGLGTTLAIDATAVTVEEQAKQWFLQGVGLERKGDLYDAVQCYRRAVQLVPDIEYRVSTATNTAGTGNTSEISSSLGTPEDSDNENDTDVGEDCDEEDDRPLLVRLLKFIEGRGWIFFDKSREDKGLHLNDLPVEVLTYILRWVVSSDLDVRSLDLLSSTCRGFYCLCRDEKIWEMACERVWSDISETPNEFSSFREMFLQRSRVRFDGCYICKVTYIRPGEHSFQDQSYRPWHFVEYYRYIRFLPNGEILFLTTSDEPSGTVLGLRDAKFPKNSSTMRGQYQLYGNNTVSAVVKKPTGPLQTPVHRGRSSKIQQTPEVTTFHMEFEICPVRGRCNWMLKWVRYAAYITRYPTMSSKKGSAVNQANPVVTTSTFDLNPNKFPPLYFSRVKSYTQKSEGIL